MLYRSRLLLGVGGLPIHRDTAKKPKMITETGKWLFSQEQMSEFLKWCAANEVRAYKTVKMASAPQYARCLRALKPIPPGRVIVSAPYKCCFNYLVAAKEMIDTDNCMFPFQLNWMNYSNSIDWLPSICMHEMTAVGWMMRIAALEESPLTPYINHLYTDTRGKEGVGTGLSKEKEEDNGMMDQVFSEMASEACEDPQVFLDHMVLGFAALFMRAQPIEEQAIEAYITGTNFFKAKACDMYVPTLVPLVDCVPQVETNIHNTVLQYFPIESERHMEEVCRSLDIPPMSMQNVKGGGFFALRALSLIEEGDVLYIRRFPKSASSTDEACMSASAVNAQELLSHYD